MISRQEATAFEELVSRTADTPAITAAAHRSKHDMHDHASGIYLAAVFCRGAFCCPHLAAEIYDSCSSGWYGKSFSVQPVPVVDISPVPLSKEFWLDFWDLVRDLSSGMDPKAATTRTAALATPLGPSHQHSVAAACRAYPDVMIAAAQGFPERTLLSDLAACPPGSLGEEFYRLIVDNNFDLEVLDRDQLGLIGLPAPLDYLNARMLQTHDLWHILAGYRTTKLHEVAISAFQLAQFGHSYSAMFLAVVGAAAAFTNADLFRVLMETTFSAWIHGRVTPQMLLIPWEREWANSKLTVRSRYGVHPYRSPYAADLFENIESAK